MLRLKIDNGIIVEVVDAVECPDGFIEVPDSFVFVSEDIRYYDINWAPKPEDVLIEEGVIPPERKIYSIATGEPKTVRVFGIPEGFTLKEPGVGQVWDGDGDEWVTPEPVPLTLGQVQDLRRRTYAAESDPIKNEADYDALVSGTTPDYTAWMAAVEAIKARYPLPSAPVAL